MHTQIVNKSRIIYGKKKSGAGLFKYKKEAIVKIPLAPAEWALIFQKGVITEIAIIDIVIATIDNTKGSVCPYL